MTEWTIETLKEHLEAQIEASRRHLDALVVAERELNIIRRNDDRNAIDKAEKAIEARLALLNEFRAQSVQEQKKFISREAVEPRLVRIENTALRLSGGLAVIAVIGVVNLVKLWLA